MGLKYIDTFSYKTAHVQFNASLLAACAYIYKNIKYYSCESNSNRVLELLNTKEKENIQYKKIFVFPGNNKYSLLFRYIISSILNVIYLLRTNKNDVIIYNFNNPLSLHLINSINKLAKRRILICCHSELELLISNRNDGGGLYKILRKSVISFFTLPRAFQKDIYYAVIGDSIYKNISGIVDKKLHGNIIIIPHPYIFNELSEISIQNDKKKINIGTVGVFNKLKGANIFYNLVKDINETVKDKINFSITGRIFYDIEKLKKENISLPENNGETPLDEREFSDRISKLDYIIYLYNNKSYKLTASGALLDAIYFNKPIISLTNDYFEYFFNKYGTIGYLAKDIDELKQIISDIVKGKQKPLKINFEKIKEMLLPKNNYQEIEQELKKIDSLE